MLPTLAGRIQTLIFALAVLGGIWALLLTPLLPIDASIGSAYKATFIILATIIVLGVGWELLYHFFQQFRWEKDWPTLFGLLTAINEGLLVWFLLAAGAVPGDLNVSGPAFTIDFVTTWLLVWLIV